jgi:hypothetical protein
VGQLVTVAHWAVRGQVALGIVALLLISGAAWWIVRRGRRAPRRPDVGTVSAQWITQHRIAPPHRSQ